MGQRIGRDYLVTTRFAVTKGEACRALGHCQSGGWNGQDDQAADGHVQALAIAEGWAEQAAKQQVATEPDERTECEQGTIEKGQGFHSRNGTGRHQDHADGQR